MAKDIECCLLVLQLCNSFMAKTCLMLAVITLYYFPNLGPFSFVFVVNFVFVVISLDRLTNFMNFDTDRLYIASLFNFDCNCHVDVVCIKL